MSDILAVGAHPDDVEISIGGTLVKMKKLGCSITVCHCTDGEPTPKVKPSFIVDISDEYRRKMEILSCYASQFNVDMDNLASTDIWGPLIGTRYGEAFYSRGTLGIHSLLDVFQRTSRGTKSPVLSNEPKTP